MPTDNPKLHPGHPSHRVLERPSHNPLRDAMLADDTQQDANHHPPRRAHTQCPIRRETAIDERKRLLAGR